MRIISASLALLIAFVIISSNVAMAAEAGESNETKTNLNIFSENKILLAYNDDENFEGFDTEKKVEKALEDSKREKALERYAEKRKSASYPKGKFTINASAYTAAADECGKSDGITASGLMVKEKETIACPPQFPMGTKIKISGMGTYICQDRGGAIKGNHVDIYMKTKKEAFAFGRKNLEAEVIL
ncbi:MAG TPA: 3D domain-containing protein [Candidatus Moranbacteria bacterium]|nr:3D domain-containing protein [Candidatus Moranbacteria bacterium]